MKEGPAVVKLPGLARLRTKAFNCTDRFMKTIETSSGKQIRLLPGKVGANYMFQLADPNIQNNPEDWSWACYVKPDGSDEDSMFSIHKSEYRAEE